MTCSTLWFLEVPSFHPQCGDLREEEHLLPNCCGKGTELSLLGSSWVTEPSLNQPLWWKDRVCQSLIPGARKPGLAPNESRDGVTCWRENEVLWSGGGRTDSGQAKITDVHSPWKFSFFSCSKQTGLLACCPSNKGFLQSAPTATVSYRFLQALRGHGPHTSSQLLHSSN